MRQVRRLLKHMILEVQENRVCYIHLSIEIQSKLQYKLYYLASTRFIYGSSNMILVAALNESFMKYADGPVEVHSFYTWGLLS